MTSLKEKWAENSKLEKGLAVGTIVISLVVIVIGILGLLKVLHLGHNNSLSMLPVAALTVLNGLTVYKKNKLAGIIIFLCATLILVCFVLSNIL
ncbi:MAG: hypothetical protein Q8876_10165, partial [Bacillota bacterium]|nr:hypothetical protein [Bacillota bacterium]